MSDFGLRRPAGRTPPPAPGNAGVSPASAAGRSPVPLRPPANRLYAIVDTGLFGARPEPVAGAVRTLLDCGVRWIQLRAKGLPDLEAWRLAEAVARVVRRRQSMSLRVREEREAYPAHPVPGDGIASDLP